MIEDIKAFLLRPRELERLILKKMAQIDGYRLSQLPRGIRYDVDRVQTSAKDPMPGYAARIDSLEQDIARLREEQFEARTRIVDATEGLSASEAAAVVYQFVACLEVWDICERMHYSRKSFYRIRNRAIEKIDAKMTHGDTP